MIYDGGGLIAPGGELFARGRRFSFHDVELATARRSTSTATAASRRAAAATARATTPRTCVVEHRFVVAARKPESRAPHRAHRGRTRYRHRRRRSSRAPSRSALWDYLRKSRAQGYVVSLSGGADSARVRGPRRARGRARARRARRRRRARARGSRCLGRDAPRSAGRPARRSVRVAARVRVPADRELRRRHAHRGARGRATRVGAEFHVIDVDAQCTAYIAPIDERRSAASSTGSTTTSRCRTSRRACARRRSGCSRTSAAPCCSRPRIAARPRSATRRWTATPRAGSRRSAASTRPSCARGCAGWRRTGRSGSGRCPRSSSINAQQPTAELRPPRRAQTDEADLMPYDLLEAVEDSAIRDKHTPLEVLQELAAAFPAARPRSSSRRGSSGSSGCGAATSGSASGSRRASTSTTRTSTPTWCRFPILSGGFERELAELDAELAAHSASVPTPGR